MEAAEREGLLSEEAAFAKQCLISCFSSYSISYQVMSFAVLSCHAIDLTSFHFMSCLLFLDTLLVQLSAGVERVFMTK